MSTSDTDGPRRGVVRALRSALETGDAAVLEGVLAENVQWFGTSFGACHDRLEVIDVLRGHLESPTRPRLTDLRVVGDGLLMRVELRHGGESTDWIAALRLDPASRITRIQDYESAAVAEHDLTVLARPRHAASGRPPATRVRGLAPIIHVTDVARAVAFYELLGLQVRRTYEPGGRLVWALLDSGTAALSIAGVDGPIDPRTQDVLLYLFTADLAGLREHLLAAGILPGEILDGTPGPRQEMRVTDPDGYCLMIAQVDPASAGGRYSAALRAEPATGSE